MRCHKLSANAVPRTELPKFCPPTPKDKSQVHPAFSSLKMCGHGVALVESFATAWTFAHAIGNPILHALVAEDMSTCLEDGVLEVDPADRANNKVLL